MRVPSLIRRRVAVRAGAAGLAASLALGLGLALALATPAAAQDDRFPAPGKDVLKLLCVIFGGIPFDYGQDVGVYGCQFDGGDLTCDGKECWIVVPLTTAPLKDECDFAGGKYAERSATVFSCDIKQGTLLLTCADKRMRQCAVGWQAATDPRG